MTLAQLIAAARREASDTVAPYLWSDADWTDYANEAQREACRRARLIVDSTTTAICRLTMVADTATYALDPRILFIKRVKLSTRTTSLRPVSFKDLDRSAPGWEDETGEPSHFVPDMDENTFRPYPTPSAAGTVSLTVIRLPLEDMEGLGDEPEIKSHLHSALVYWMMHEAYAKQDSETLDKQKSADNLAAFEAEFGKKSTAQDEAWIRREHGYTEDEGIY